MTANKITKTLTVQFLTIHLIKSIVLVLSILIISSCGGPSKEPPCSRSEDVCKEPTPEPLDIWWDAPLTDFSDNPDRPIITLIGDSTQFISLGDDYLESGAMALDDQDGDISSDIIINSQVNTDTVGDYLVRYAVTDSSGIAAIEQIRIIRIIDNSAAKLSRRPLGSSIANFGYLEHLPVDYGVATEQKSPLLIYLHGGGGNLEFTETSDPTLALDAVINNYGIPKIIEDGQWNESLPFVVLAPHLGAVPSAGYKARLNAFIEFATHSYNIDINRIYLTGYSQGGFLSSVYAKDFPDKVAAIAAISPAFPFDVDPFSGGFCNIERVPVWFFHATNDEVIPFGHTIRVYNSILDHCQALVLPKLSLVIGAEHAIHHAVYNLEALEGGYAQAVYDTRFETYDTSIYQWLLSHSLLDR